MAAKKKAKAKSRSKKKSHSWEEVGKIVGEKIGSEIPKKKCFPWDEPWTWHKHKDDSGCFGRLVFIIALLYILSVKGMLTGISIWSLIALTIGFMLMRL